MTTFWRAALAIATLLLAALIVRAALSADFFEAFGRIARDPWGLVSLVDLYLGFLMFAVVIVGFDGRGPATTLWVIGLFLLGNLVGAIWLISRYRRLREALLAARRLTVP